MFNFKEGHIDLIPNLAATSDISRLVQYLVPHLSSVQNDS